MKAAQHQLITPCKKQDGHGVLLPTDAPVIVGANGHGVWHGNNLGQDGHGQWHGDNLGQDGHGQRNNHGFGANGHGIRHTAAPMGNNLGTRGGAPAYLGAGARPACECTDGSATFWRYCPEVVLACGLSSHEPSADVVGQLTAALGGARSAICREASRATGYSLGSCPALTQVETVVAGADSQLKSRGIDISAMTLTVRGQEVTAARAVVAVAAWAKEAYAEERASQRAAAAASTTATTTTTTTSSSSSSSSSSEDCVTKGKWGTWCPQADGSWVRESDGKVWSAGKGEGDATAAADGEAEWTEEDQEHYLRQRRLAHALTSALFMCILIVLLRRCCRRRQHVVLREAKVALPEQGQKDTPVVSGTVMAVLV